MQTFNKIIIVIPAYNEHERVKEAVSKVRAAGESLRKLGLQPLVYVVNDGSSDDTGALAKEAGADRIVKHPTNRGLGAAVRTGLMAAYDDGADIAVKIDADMQHNPEEIVDLIQPLLNDESDIVYGYRFERIEYKMPFVRRMGNKVFSRLMSSLTGWEVKDGQPGIFAVSRSYLEVFRIPGDYNYTQQILLDAYHKGMRFTHVPVTFRKRTTGKSFVSLKYPFKVLPQIFMVLVGVKPMRIFAPIGLLFLFGAGGIFTLQIIQYLIGESIKPVENVNLVLGMGLFGMQTFFFGVLAQLIVERRR